MKLVLNIIAVLLIVVGVVWSLQGFNVLPSSVMGGQIQWAIAGIVAAIVGIGLLVFTNRRPKGTPPKTGSDKGR